MRSRESAMLIERQGNPSGLRHSAGVPRPTVAIVGAGASGMLAATHLLRAASHRGQSLSAVLIDRDDRSGGVAYSTRDPTHRLNVTAARMSALPDEPDHFVRWRAATTGAANPGEYAPRSQYRRYLEEVLEASRRAGGPGIMLARLRAEVDALEVSPGHARLRFTDGGALDVDAAVLAVGNMAPLPPAGCVEATTHDGYVNDPWAPGALDRLEGNRRSTILPIGTGLTMVDVASTIAARCPAARIRAVSRSGLLPRAHLPGRVGPEPSVIALDPRLSLPVLVDTVLAQSAAGNPCWHQLVDDLRPLTQTLWKRLSLAERAEFLATRHRAWCVRRHRMPPEVGARLAEMIGSGQLTVRSGSVELAPSATGGLESLISGSQSITVDQAINCAGPGLDPRMSRNPLIVQLLADGHARAHPLGIGFDTSHDGAFLTREGTPSAHLFTLGPPRIGELYETTAIPEIRVQAHALAASLVATLAGVPASAGLTAQYT
jgi:uncharacterized NAD(P)/FAD-binding protein YdhS